MSLVGWLSRCPCCRLKAVKSLGVDRGQCLFCAGLLSSDEVLG